MSNGTAYPINEVFPSGVLDEEALVKFGLPKLTGTFAFAMFMANAAVSNSGPNSLRGLICIFRLVPLSFIVFSFGVKISNGPIKAQGKADSTIGTMTT
jgi:hypothetical protein